MRRYGEVHQSEAFFEKKTPRWNYNPDSWWYHCVGRENGKDPLWMRREWHLPELDCPPGKDRHRETIDDRRRGSDTPPLWAQRMNLSGNFQGNQSATIYGHRREYKPTEKTDARSMVRELGMGLRWLLSPGGGSPLLEGTGSCHVISTLQASRAGTAHASHSLASLALLNLTQSSRSN